MAQSSIQTKCSMSDDGAADTSCKGCSKDFCFDHLAQHRQVLNEQLGVIQNDYQQFKQTIIDVKNNSQNHPLIKQIYQWEYDFIRTIKQKANECRQLLNDHINQCIHQVEIHLNDLREKLEELKKQMNLAENLFIKQIPNSFISEISVQSTHFQK